MSEARRQKKLEKKRAKRKEMVKERHRQEYRPIREYPLDQAYTNPDWKTTRSARIGFVRRHPESGFLLSEFLVDLDGFGLRDCFAPRRISTEALQEFMRREERIKADPAVAAAIVLGGVRWANQYRFPLPKDARKALDILPDPGDCPADFGRDGEPYLRGEEADIRARVRQSGRALEEFECALFPARPKETTVHFVTEEYLKTGDRNDPLIRLERLASLADRYEKAGAFPKAEELHATMEELATEARRYPDFLRYLARYWLRRERMEKALSLYERVVAVTEEPTAKALARLDHADFSRYLGDALGADEVYQKVMADFPDLVEARLRYCAFLYETARREESKTMYRGLIEELAGRGGAPAPLAAAYQAFYTILVREGSPDAKAVYKEAKKQGLRLQ